MLDVYWLVGFPICAMIALSEAGHLSLGFQGVLAAGGLVGFIVMGILWWGRQQIVGLTGTIMSAKRI